MIHLFDPLREFSFLAVLVRLILAMFCGGILGMERERKGRPAGFRTYMLVCVGAALTVLLGLYMYQMLQGPWVDTMNEIGTKTDVSRFAAQVINGIGFLGAGTIIVTGKSEVKGLTTAACLWAAACMGIAVGAGFYEIVLLGTIFMFLTTRVMSHIENAVVRHSQNMNFYIEMSSMNAIGSLISSMKTQGIHIYDVDVDRGDSKMGVFPSAVFYTRLTKGTPHPMVLAVLSKQESVLTIYEL